MTDPELGESDLSTPDSGNSDTSSTHPFTTVTPVASLQNDVTDHTDQSESRSWTSRDSPADRVEAASGSSAADEDTLMSARSGDNHQTDKEVQGDTPEPKLEVPVHAFTHEDDAVLVARSDVVFPNGHVGNDGDAVSSPFNAFGDAVTVLQDEDPENVVGDARVAEEVVADADWITADSTGAMGCREEEVVDDEMEVEDPRLPHQIESYSIDASRQLDPEQDSQAYELELAGKIVRELMSDLHKSSNWPFLDPVDVEGMKLWDYRERVKRPIWLKKIRDKCENEYSSIDQMVSDFRLMLENCYRYNGPDHYISKRGQRLEQVFEQKLSLLSKSLREKSAVELTNPDWLTDVIPNEFGLRRRTKPAAGTPAVDLSLPSAPLLSTLRAIQEEQQREKKKSAMLEKRQLVEAKWQTIQQWEEELLPLEVRLQMKHLPELPQIGLFLYLCQSALNLPELNQFDVERCCVVPRQSQSMSYIMTSLLSTPFQRKDLDRKPPMPYRVWESKLKKRVGVWYHQSRNRHTGEINTIKAQYQLGLDPTFFDILGPRANPLEKLQFHELTFYQRVWILKALCDYCLESQSHLRESIELNHVTDQRQVVLGVDAAGDEYIHFPQFCGADLRIYKVKPAPWPELEKISKKQLRKTEEAAEARTASNLAYLRAPSRKRKELLKKIRGKIKDQKQYEKERKLEIKLAEKRKKMEEKKKRREERAAAKGPRPSGLRQSVKVILKPEELQSSESSATESSDDDGADDLVGAIPFDEPLPEEMPIEEEEDPAPMLFGDSEEEDEELEEDEDDSDWDVKKEKKKGKKSLRKRSRRDGASESDEASSNEGRRKGKRVAARKSKKEESDGEEEDRPFRAAKGRKTPKKVEEESGPRKRGPKPGRGKTPKGRRGRKSTSGKNQVSDEETEGEPESNPSRRKPRKRQKTIDQEKEDRSREASVASSTSKRGGRKKSLAKTATIAKRNGKLCKDEGEKCEAGRTKRRDSETDETSAAEDETDERPTPAPCLADTGALAAADEETFRGLRANSRARRTSKLLDMEPNDSDSSFVVERLSGRLPMRKSARDRKTPRKFSPSSSTRSSHRDDANSNADSASNLEAPSPADASVGKRIATSAVKEKTTVWSFLTEMAQEDIDDKGMTIQDVEKAFAASGDENEIRSAKPPIAVGTNVGKEESGLKTDTPPTPEDDKALLTAVDINYGAGEGNLEKNDDAMANGEDSQKNIGKVDGDESKSESNEENKTEVKTEIKLEPATGFTDATMIESKEPEQEKLEPKSEELPLNLENAWVQDIKDVKSEKIDASAIPENFVGPLESDSLPKILEPDLTTFELVADSIDSLKELIRRLKKDPDWEPRVVEDEGAEEGDNPESNEKNKEDTANEEADEASSTRSKSSTPVGIDTYADSETKDSKTSTEDDERSSFKHSKSKQPKRDSRNESELLEELEALLTELQPFERKLNDAGRRMRLKLQKDVTEYKEENDNDAWESDIDEDDDIRTASRHTHEENSNDAYTPRMGEPAYDVAFGDGDGGRRSLRVNPRPSKRKLEMDRENELILQGVQDEYTDLCRSEEFDIVEVSSRGRVRKVRRLGIDEAERITARSRPSRGGSRKSTPFDDDDDDEEEDDDLDDVEDVSNTSFADVREMSVSERRSFNARKAAKSRWANRDVLGANIVSGAKKTKKDPAEVSREILANSKLSAAITAFKETGKLPDGMELEGRGSDGRPVILRAETLEKMKHLDNYKILTTLLTQNNPEPKTFVGYSPKEKPKPEVIYKNVSAPSTLQSIQVCTASVDGGETNKISKETAIVVKSPHHEPQMILQQQRPDLMATNAPSQSIIINGSGESQLSSSQISDLLSKKFSKQPETSRVVSHSRSPFVVGVPGSNTIQVIQPQAGQQRLLLCPNGGQRVFAINGQQVVQQVVVPQQLSSTTEQPQQQLVLSQPPLLNVSAGSKMAPSGVVLLRASAPVAETSTVSTVSQSPGGKIVQTAGGSIILNPSQNPRTSNQPLIASVRLPNGDTQQILLNTQQVAAHQQLANLQAQHGTKPRLIAPASSVENAVSSVASVQQLGSARQPTPQIVRYVNAQGSQQTVQLIQVQNASTSMATPATPVNNNAVKTSTRCVTVRNLLESRDKTLVGTETERVTGFPDSVSPVPDVVATQIMTNAKPAATASNAALQRDVTALTQSVTGPIPAVKPDVASTSSVTPPRSSQPATVAVAPPRLASPTQKVTFKIAVPPNQLQQIPGKGFVTPQGVVLNPAALQQAIGTQVLQQAAMTGEPIVLDERRLARILAVQKEQSARENTAATPTQNPLATPPKLKQEKTILVKSPPNQFLQTLPQSAQPPPQIVAVTPDRVQSAFVPNAARTIPLQQQQLSPQKLAFAPQGLPQAIRAASVSVAGQTQGPVVQPSAVTLLSPTKEQLARVATVGVNQQQQQGRVVLLNVGGRLVPVQAVSSQQIVVPQQQQPQSSPQQHQLVIPLKETNNATSPLKYVQIAQQPRAGVAPPTRFIQLTQDQLKSLTPAQLDQLRQLIPGGSVVEQGGNITRLSHAQYGVTSEEIRIFTHCLELTLKMELGLKLTKQGLQAWNTALKLLNRAFCEGLEKGNRKTMKIIKRQAAKN